MSQPTTRPATPLLKPPTPLWKKLLIVGLLLGCVAGAGLFYWAFSAPGRRLDDAFAEADRLDPGWRLEDIEAKRLAIPNAENSALVVLTARGLMPRRLPVGEDLFAFNRRLEELPPPQQLNAEEIARLREEVAKLQPVLTEAGKLVNMPRGRYPIQWRPIAYHVVLLSNDARPVADLLSHDAMLRAQDGDIEGALQVSLAIFNVSRSIGDEEFLVSQLTRSFARRQAVRAIERALAQGQATEESLARLQHELATDFDHPAQLIGLRGDRAAMDNAMEAVQNGQMSLRQLIGLKDQGLTEMLDRVREGSPGYQRACLLLVNNQYVEIAKLPSHQQAEKLEELKATMERQPESVRIFSHVQANLTNTFHNHDAELRCAVAGLAVERYRLKHGRWPATLDELVPEFLDRVPNDVFTGQPLRYRLVEDGVIVYSVGADKEDNEGRVDPKRARHSAGQDVRFRLWHGGQRRQAARANGSASEGSP